MNIIYGGLMLLNAIKNRYSVRKFKDKPVEQEKLDIILEAARLAPSSCNTQPWKFVVIRDEEKRKQLTEACKGKQWVADAPVTIAICANNTDYVMTCGQLAYTIDASLAGEHICLQASELGLGTCWIGAFFHDKMAKIINLPDDYKIVGLLPLGYPDDEKGTRDLKPFNEVVVSDSF